MRPVAPALRSASRDDRVGDAVAAAAGRRRSWPRTPSSITRPRASTIGPPELPLTHAPAQRRDRAAHRPAPVGVLGQHGRASPPRGPAATSNGPLSGKPSIAPAVPGRTLGASASARRGRGRARAGPRRRRAVSKCDRARVAAAAPVAGHLDGRVVLAGDDVRVRHDEPVRRHPAASPRRRARTRCRGSARRSRAAARRPASRASPPAAARRRPRGRRAPAAGRSARAR